MQRLGADFLAGAALAGDEDRRAGRRDAGDLFEDAGYRRRTAEKAGETVDGLGSI